MTQLEQILCNKFGGAIDDIYDLEDGLAAKLEYEYHRTADPHKIFECMKEYAEIYAAKVLKLAAENATCEIADFPYSAVDKDSILNIKLPQHI